MSGYTPSTQFQEAAVYLSNAPSLSMVSDAIKLELYGLFKFITSSHSPPSSKPSIFNITARAKWDAWKQTETAYGNRDQDAEERYMQLAHELGWTKGLSSRDPQDQLAAPTHTKDGEDGIWDDEETNIRSKSSGHGMGVRVSTMGTEAEDKEGTLHTFAMTGNTGEVAKYLRAHPEVDLNATNSNGYTLLHLACDRGHLPVVELLLTKGVDQSIQDPDEFTAIELARIAEHDDIVALLEQTGLP